VILWIGTNDIITNSRTGAQVEGDIQLFISNLTGTPKIVICTLQAFTPNNTLRQDLNTLLKANFGSYANVLVKLDEASELSNSANATYFQADGVHLTDAGYAVVGGLVQTGLAGLA
jgi:lysophospholipase L1-like esterase